MYCEDYQGEIGRDSVFCTTLGKIIIIINFPFLHIEKKKTSLEIDRRRYCFEAFNIIIMCTPLCSSFIWGLIVHAVRILPEGVGEWVLVRWCMYMYDTDYIRSGGFALSIFAFSLMIPSVFVWAALPKLWLGLLFSRFSPIALRSAGLLLLGSLSLAQASPLIFGEPRIP